MFKAHSVMVTELLSAQYASEVAKSEIPMAQYVSAMVAKLGREGFATGSIYT